MTFTVITGASHGLGLALAKENARLGRNLILISLPNEGLDKIAQDIQKQFKVKVIVMEADLTDIQTLQQLCKNISENYQIDILINNAGIGGTYNFLDASENFINRIIDLNIRASVFMTYYLLPNLLKQKQAYILNIASLAALNPLPYKTIYPASKVFLDFFSKSLAIEFQNTNILISIAYPGAMPTNQQIIDQINSHSKSMHLFVMNTEKTAKILMKQLLKKRELIIPGFFNKFTWLLIKIIPYPIRKWYLRKVYRKELSVSKKYNYGQSFSNRSKWAIRGKHRLST